MKNIKNYQTFSKVERIHKGWSSDEKYYVETENGEQLLLRLADITQYDVKQKEFEVMKQIAVLELPMSQPVDFGVCNEGKNVYVLLTWCKGEDAEGVLSTLTVDEQYAIGRQVGRYLKKIHSIQVSETTEEWGTRFERKVRKKMDTYLKCGLRFEGDESIINYLENKMHLLQDRPQTYHHGDYHVGNMVIEGKDISIIDFNRYDIGDPWEEFNRIVWSATASPHFAIGQIQGYFDGNPPIMFFELLAFYIASNTLSSVYWAIQFGQDQIDVMMNQAQDVLQWFDDMKNPIPKWFRENIREEIEIDVATIDDLNSWMEMIAVVRWNFPGLETESEIQEYKEVVIKNINRGTAICAKHGNRVVGLMIFSKKHNQLCCMAVHPEYRKQQIATQMIQLMIEKLDPNRDVHVTTFRADDEKGIAPRALYKKLGFIEGEMCEEFGYPHQKFILHNSISK